MKKKITERIKGDFVKEYKGFKLYKNFYHDKPNDLIGFTKYVAFLNGNNDVMYFFNTIKQFKNSINGIKDYIYSKDYVIKNYYTNVIYIDTRKYERLKAEVIPVEEFSKLSK